MGNKRREYGMRGGHWNRTEEMEVKQENKVEKEGVERERIGRNEEGDKGFGRGLRCFQRQGDAGDF